jgi:2,3-diketo-5-methylthio-1-phosphopentane phosphatase
MTRRTAWLCDFDGTIAPVDIGASLIERFARGAEAERRELLARWRREEIGSRELTRAECRAVRVTLQEALEFVRGFEIDRGFAAFARAALERGDRVLVVSDGFDFYIREQLSRAGLGDVPFAANRARFVGGGLEPEFPFDEGCGRCGNCKAQHVRAERERGFRTVMVGDGLSDRCGAREADAVVARGGLLEWCRREGRDATPFLGFEALADGTCGADRRAAAGA